MALKTISLEQEINPWEAQAARFDFAAQKLNLDEGLMEGPALSHPRNHRAHSGADGQRPSRSLHRLPRAALHRPRPGQGRHPLRARRHARRSARPGQLDDLEVRRGQHSLRRRQGRRHLRSPQDVAGRTGAHDPPLHRRTDRIHRPGKRRSRARHEHQRADHGLDHGHLLHAHAPDRDRRGHRQAASTSAARADAAKPPAAAS